MSNMGVKPMSSLNITLTYLLNYPHTSGLIPTFGSHRASSPCACDDLCSAMVHGRRCQTLCHAAPRDAGHVPALFQPLAALSHHLRLIVELSNSFLCRCLLRSARRGSRSLAQAIRRYGSLQRFVCGWRKQSLMLCSSDVRIITAFAEFKSICMHECGWLHRWLRRSATPPLTSSRSPCHTRHPRHRLLGTC